MLPMIPLFGLTEFGEETPLAPLGVLGYWLRQRDWFRPWREALPWRMQTRQHSPLQKLEEVLVAILAGCRALSEINTKIRLDLVLAKAWGRAQFAEQSNVSRLLDALTFEHVEGLRQVHPQWLLQAGQAVRHQGKEGGLLQVDLDFTGLPGTPQGEGSTKGYFCGRRNVRGRQIARISAPLYGETLLSHLYPGAAQGRDHLPALLREWETTWPWPESRRREILWRTDAGFGTDANINLVLAHGYHLVAKGYSGKRAAAFARQIRDWTQIQSESRWSAPAVHPIRYGRKTQTGVRRWRTQQGAFKHALLISTLVTWTPEEVDRAYDLRAQVEVELKGDKDGLGMEHRQKRSFAAQEALVILTDTAHNLVSWLKPWMLEDTSAAKWGPKRMIRDFFQVPGRLVFDGDRLVQASFLQTHPSAPLLVEGFPRLFTH